MAGVLLIAFTLFSLTATFWGSFVEKDYGAKMIPGELVLGLIVTLLFLLSLLGVIGAIQEEIEKQKSKGRECKAVCLDGLPGFKREQEVHLTLDIKDLSLLFDDRKDQKIALKFQQIKKLNYIDWEGDITRWVEGSNGYSYPGLFEGTRVYVPPTAGYSKTEKLRVKRALEIQYRDQRGVPRSIVLDVSKDGSLDGSYAEALLESLCRCTRLPAPQYIKPVKPAKPGPKYL